MSGPLPPQKPAVTNRPQPIPTQPIPNQTQPIPTEPLPAKPGAGPDETKRTYFLLAVIGGIAFAVLILMAGVIGLIFLLTRSGSGSDGDTDRVADAEAQASPWKPSTDRPNRPNRFTNPNDFKELDSFRSAMVAFKSNDHIDQQRALKWFQSNSLTKSQQISVLDQTAILLGNGGSSSVRSACFQLLFAKGNGRHTSAVIAAAKKNRVSDKDMGRWFKKHNDAKYAKDLIDLLQRSGSPSRVAKSGLVALGRKIEPTILQHINSKHYGVRRGCLEVLKAWKTSEKKIATQCIIDLTNPNRSISDALRWLKSHEPIEELKGKATEQMIQLMANKETQTKYQYEVVRIVFLWGDENACRLIADAGERVFTDKKVVAEFLMKYNTRDAARGLAQLIGNYRVNRTKIVAALEKYGADAEEFVIPWVNDSDQRKRDDARKLLKHYKTDRKKIATQCIADFTTDEPSLRHRATTAIEYLAKLEPDTDSDVAGKLGKMLSEELKKEKRSFTTEKIAFAFCRWAGPTQKQMLQTLVDDSSYRICAAAIMRQLQLDPDEGKRNLKKHYADSSRRRELGKRLIEKGAEMEEVVYELLTTSDESEVVDALNILKQIGTSKSVPQIEKVASIAKKFNKRRASRAAEEALAAVKGRN